MILRSTEPLPGHGVSVIETYQPLAIWAVKGQRVIQAMRLLWRHAHPGHHNANLMTALRIHDKHLPVQVEKHIERRVARRCHEIRLSH